MQKVAIAILFLLFIACVGVILYVTGILNSFLLGENKPQTFDPVNIWAPPAVSVPFNTDDSSVKSLATHVTFEGRVVDARNRAGITEITFINLDTKVKVLTLPLNSATVVFLDSNGIQQKGARASVVPGKQVKIEAQYDHKIKGWTVTEVIVY